jgi:excisionase family DNA binding protein
MRRTPGRRPVVASEPAPNRLALTVPEVAWLLHCSPNTVWGLIRNGRLDSFMVGRRRLVARSVIDAFISDGGTRGVVDVTDGQERMLGPG